MTTGSSPKVVSIICPVRNMSGRLEMLEKWIRDITEYPQVEVVVVYDFSDDSTEVELKLLCSRYESVTLVQGQYGNPGSARNAGLEICTGKWVSFWDCDDEPIIDEYLLIIEKIEQANPDIVFGRFKVFHENSKLVIEAPSWSSAIRENLEIVAQNPGIWRAIFSRDMLNEISFEPLRMAEDQIFIAKAILKASKVAFFDNQIYTYFTGSDYHLTKNTAALQDLLLAFDYTSKIITTGNLEAHSFLHLMAARQLISGFKFGTLRTRINLIRSMFTSGLMFRSLFLSSIFKSISIPKWGS